MQIGLDFWTAKEFGTTAPTLRLVFGALVHSLDIAVRRRVFGVVTQALLNEAERMDAGLAKRLAGPLRELAG